MKHLSQDSLCHGRGSNRAPAKYKSVVLSVDQWFPKWAVPPTWGLGGAKKKKSGRGVLEVGPSQRVVRIFPIEVTSDQKIGNWYCFMKLIQCFKILLAMFVVIKYGTLFCLCYGSIRLLTSPPSMSQVSRKCENLDVLQTYGPPWPVTWMALPFFFNYIILSLVWKLPFSGMFFCRRGKGTWRMSLGNQEEGCPKNYGTNLFILYILNKLRGFSPQANNTDRATADCRRS
jgi:hypothetical protein